MKNGQGFILVYSIIAQSTYDTINKDNYKLMNLYHTKLTPSFPL
jgi:protein-disulfide isomerase